MVRSSFANYWKTLLDVAAAYPNNQSVFNVARSTTRKEIIEIEGIPEEVVRAKSINLSGGPTNAVEFCTTMLKLPQMFELLDMFNETHSY